LKSTGPESFKEYALRYGVHDLEADVAETMFEPTDAMPGSPEKIEVLAKRLALGQPLFHSKDKTVLFPIEDID